ncbi:MAG TPA: hypothetical protein VN514_03020 [Ignavibacteria bacterium]|nr:hypothetical protein [Ignavibacteria bacterium]
MVKFQVKYYISFAVSLFFFCIFCFALPLEYLLNFAHDDSFFYLKIAGNFSEGLGLTFDGFTRTNGYHPLYLTVLSLLFSLFRFLSVTSPEIQFRFVCVLHLLILHLTALTAYLFFRKEKNGTRKFILFLLLCLPLVFIRDFGLESHLSCLIFSLLVYNKFRKEQQKQIQLLNAVLISLLFLSRIDYLWSLAPFLIIADVLTAEKASKKSVLLYDVSAVTLTAGFYFIVNFLAFKNLMPVSAVVISSFPETVFAENVKNLFTDTSYLYNQTARFIFLLIAAVVLLISKSKSKETYFCLTAIAGGIAGLLINTAFSKYNIREWYLTLPVFISLFALSGIYEFRSKVAEKLIAFFLCLFFIAVFAYTRAGNFKWNNSYEYAKIIQSKTEKKDFIYQFDYSGAVSFFSDRNIVNGDGLVNDFEYYNYLKSGRISDYIKAKNIGFVSTIVYNDLKTDSAGKLIFESEPFLNGLNLGRNDIVNIFGFDFRHAVRPKKGNWILIKTGK